MKVSEEHLFPADQRFESILDSIPDVRNFKGKWSLIRARLLDLKTHISEISDFPSSATNVLSLDLLRSVPATLSDVASLCEACKAVNLPNGKLRTQNDVDSVSARLDCHIHDAGVLIKSGVLQDDAVYGSSSSSSFSKRESVRAETRCLITRLQIGSAESRNSAMDSLVSLLHEDDKNVVIAVGQGIVPVLVRLLDSLSSSPEMREKTVAAIARVSAVDSSKIVSIAEGLLLLNNLLRVLESGSGFAKEKSCIALNALSRTKENARAIGSRGGISSLLEICQAGTPISQAAAAGVLRNLSEFAEIKENFIEEDAISVLLSLSSTGTAAAQENAIACLSQLSTDDDQLKLFIARQGGIECLKTYWDSSPTIPRLEPAVNLVTSLSISPPIAELLLSEGFPNKLVSLLTCGVLTVRIASAKAIYELGFSSRTQKDVWDCGCIPTLVRMLDGKAIEEKEAAAMALSAVIGHGGNKKIFRKEERGIIGTVQLLDPTLQGLDKKYPVSILASLVESKKCRKEMVAAGACMYLQKLLAEMADVEGAKKLSECLGKGKLWGVFARP